MSNRRLVAAASLTLLFACLASGCPRSRTGRPGPTPPSDGGTDSGRCTTGSCPAGQVCNTTTGVCEEDGPANCLVDGCPAGQICNASTGLCESMMTGCTPGGCPAGQICNTATGACQPSGCTPGSCPAGQMCNAATGLCEMGCSIAPLVEPIPSGVGNGRCSAATEACIDACDPPSPSCQTDCIGTDSTPPVSVMGMPVDCGACLDFQFAFCLDSMGAHPESEAFGCCLQTFCPTPTTTCVQMNCLAEIQALQMHPAFAACANFTNPVYDVCF